MLKKLFKFKILNFFYELAYLATTHPNTKTLDRIFEIEKIRKF